MFWILAAVAIILVVVMALVVVGRETEVLAQTVRPSVFVMEEAVAFIAGALPPSVAGRLTHDDVRWVLRADADLLEAATGTEPGRDRLPATDLPAESVLYPDDAVARILGRAEEDDRALADSDVVAVLDARNEYLRAIGAIGPSIDDPDEFREDFG